MSDPLTPYGKKPMPLQLPHEVLSAWKDREGPPVLTTAFDLTLSYNHSFLFLRNIEASMTFMNVLNRKDVAIISTSSYKTLKTLYQPVAPFTVIGFLEPNYRTVTK